MNIFPFFKRAGLTACFTVLLFAFSPKSAEDNPSSSEPLIGDSTDVLADALLINGPDAPKPPVKFSEGHVTDNQDSSGYQVKQTDFGYTISFGSGTQIPSPSIHNGKLYTGGGFSSMIFHCFDATTGKHSWTKNVDDDGPSSPVIEKNTVVFNTESCTIFALNAETGEMKWSWYMGDPMMSMPAIVKGRVITSYPAAYGYITDENDSNGNLNQLNMNDDIFKAPDAVKKNEIKSRLVPDHVLACLDLETGKIIWQKWIDGDVMSAPIGAGDEVLVTTFPGTTYKFSVEDGKILSANSLRSTSAPVVVNGMIFTSRRTDNNANGTATEELTGMDNKMTSKLQMNEKSADYLTKQVQLGSAMKTASVTMDANNGFGSGAPVSSGYMNAEANVGQSNVSSLQAFQGSRALNFGGRFFSCMGDEVIANDMNTGEVKWKVKLGGNLHELGGFLGTPPLAAGGKIIVATIEGDVVLYDPESGAETARFKTGHPIRQQPVVDGGWIYATSTDGYILAINTKDPKMTGWPVWGHDNAHSGVSQ